MTAGRLLVTSASMRDGLYEHNEFKRDARVIVNNTGSIQGVWMTCVKGEFLQRLSLVLGLLGRQNVIRCMCLLPS